LPAEGLAYSVGPTACLGVGTANTIPEKLGSKRETNMRNARLTIPAVLIAGLLGMILPAFAHNPICNCYKNPDDTVTCEGGFSDGTSAEGVAIRILDARDRVLIDGKMDKDNKFSFKQPPVEFHVVFDAGQGHLVTIYQEDIE